MGLMFQYSLDSAVTQRNAFREGRVTGALRDELQVTVVKESGRFEVIDHIMT